MGKEFSGRGKVAVLRTSPETVLEDYARLMELAGFQDALPEDKDTILKVNISWQTWYPACSTAPWQLEGVIQALQGLQRTGQGCRTVPGDHHCRSQRKRNAFVVPSMADPHYPGITARSCGHKLR